jgi:hypothetical protein
MMSDFTSVSQKDLREIENNLKRVPIRDWDYPRVAVFLPLERTMSYVDSVLPQIAQIAQAGADFIWGEYSAVAIGRNKAAVQLLGTDLTHILMLDLDHTHPADIAHRLAKWVVAYPDIQVVGGLNFGRRPPYNPCIAINDGDSKKWIIPTGWEKGTLFEVDMLGTGCILISRTVFEDLTPPWFENDFSMWETGYYAGEDTVFSRRCREAGIKLLCDPAVTSPHIDYHTVTEDTWRSYYATQQP